MEFKVGDEVICIPGFKKFGGKRGNGGSGYKEGRRFIIDKIDVYREVGESVAWGKNKKGDGVHVRALKLFNEEPNYEIY